MGAKGKPDPGTHRRGPTGRPPASEPRLVRLSPRHYQAMEMKIRGMKQNDIAKALGVGPTVVSRWFTIETVFKEAYQERLQSMKDGMAADTQEWWKGVQLNGREVVNKATEAVNRILNDPEAKDADVIAAARLAFAIFTPAKVGTNDGEDATVELQSALEVYKGGKDAETDSAASESGSEE